MDKADASEHFDVLVIGAGISGIGAAYHLRDQCPDKRFVVFEKLESFGGTWLMHRFPGVRSDSDLYTFGYRFKPWTNAPIASAAEILKYMGEVIDENDLAPHICYGHRITGASWSTRTNRWTISADTENGRKVVTAGFLWMCQGYYNHDEGYTPEWEGMGDFTGRIVHPQTWPADIDLKDKRAIVIGSGATAATLVPAIADVCSHVTLLQRSPTYFLAGPNDVPLANHMRKIGVDEEIVHHVIRLDRLHFQQMIWQRCIDEPDIVRAEILSQAASVVGEDLVREHFSPSYRPWQQRLAFIPDGDLFEDIAQGQASVVTDHIERFTDKGILLKSGRELEADVIITATGFNMSVMGDIPFDLDGIPVDWSQTVTYRGMMFTGIPNLAWIFGYFRFSWTLRVDLVADFICRLLKHMDSMGVERVTPQLRPEDAGMTVLPWTDADDFNPSYLMRSVLALPRRGDKPEWMHNQDYGRELQEFPAIDLDGAEFVYGGQPAEPSYRPVASRSGPRVSSP